jgi:ubiquinone/menaquinone biosynthesis C-methylase UbiE
MRPSPPARDGGSMREYYDARAEEYDATSYGSLDREQAAEVRAIQEALGGLPPVRVLDVACGTGQSTAALQGRVVGLDASERMLRVARDRLPGVAFVRAAVPPIPFADRSFDRLHTAHFYGHLDDTAERRAFVHEARRVAGQLVVVDAFRSEGLPEWKWEDRTLRSDGSMWKVYKRYFTPEELLEELGGQGSVVYAGRWFLAVAASAY